MKPKTSLDRQNEKPSHPVPNRRLHKTHPALRRRRTPSTSRRIRPPETPRKIRPPPSPHHRSSRLPRPPTNLGRIRPIPPNAPGPQPPTARPRHRPRRRVLRRHSQIRYRDHLPRQNDTGPRTSPYRTARAGLPCLHHSQGPPLSHRPLTPCTSETYHRRHRWFRFQFTWQCACLFQPSQGSVMKSVEEVRGRRDPARQKRSRSPPNRRWPTKRPGRRGPQTRIPPTAPNAVKAKDCGPRSFKEAHIRPK